MAVRINYLEIRNQASIRVGEIEFFDSYKTPSTKFPYFYLDQKNTEIRYQNWPSLVPYLFSRTISFVNADKVLSNSFPIASFSNSAGSLATLNFTDANALNIIRALIEDRNTYYLDNNNSYTGWNRTLTFLQSIIISGVTYFVANATHYINSISINEQTSTGSITVSSNSSNVLSTTNLTNINVEFGLFRIPGQSSTDSVYYSMTKGKFLCNNDNSVFVNGLKFRSQIIGHAHDHQHGLNNHAHTMAHTHSLNNHTHLMTHNHIYTDNRSTISTISVGDSYFKTMYSSLSNYDQYRETSNSNEFTFGPSINVTSEASNTITDSISATNTSGILAKTTDDDNALFSSSNLNFKVSSKNIPEAYTVYAYFYGGAYVG